ncbi:hypothetical protein B0H16DRAFT_792733 [Mycena metata]|uniref:Uncharacterized protein n=1 Tax=Mycena metata TaxID=1033252 RepID=A0AAD7DTA0_9AGAR|nr:hypothetical protein B0H16DRAFT_792733 [Mycena metata]
MNGGRRRRRRRRSASRMMPFGTGSRPARSSPRRLGPYTATPPSSPSAGRRRVQGVWMVGRRSEAEAARMVSHMMPFRTGSCSRIYGGMNLAHIIMRVVLVAVRSRPPWGAWIRAMTFVMFPAAVECRLCACPPRCLILPPPPSLSSCVIAPSHAIHLSTEARPVGRRLRTFGEGNRAWAPRRRRRRRHEWERARDAEGRVEVALVGSHRRCEASAVGGVGAGSTIAALAPRQHNVLASPADVHVRRPPPASKPSTPAPGHASSSSGPALPYRMLYAVPRGGDIRHAAGPVRLLIFFISLVLGGG